MVVLVGGLLAVLHHTLAIASFLLFQVYILRIIDNIRRSSWVVRQMEAVSGDAQEMTEQLEQAPLIQDKPTAKKVILAKGIIELKDVSFHYSDAATSKKPLFEGFDLTVKAGQKIGLVGPSGGGKTTLTRLLLRFMDIQAGEILIDNYNIQDIKQQQLRRAIAYVPQEPLLFHRSIKDNIGYGKPDASDDEIVAVAKKAF